MNDDTINDLKQFISATVSQEVAGLKIDINGLKSDVGSIKHDIAEMKQELKQDIADLSNSVAEALDQSNEEVHTQLKNHNQRITTLEQTV